MSSIINAGVDGIVLTASSTAALNVQVGGTNAIQIGTGATTTISNATITSLTISNPSVFPAGSASAPAITTTGDTNTGMYFPAADQVAVTAGGTVAAAFNSNGLFFRNRIINGDMRIAQRGTAAVTTSQAFPVDRFRVPNGTDGAFSAQQDSSAPTGFTNSLKYTVTTADTNLTTTQNTNVTQVIEGTNIADLAWGTANARTVTLSFWVRSSLTGTFGGGLRNGDATRSYPFTYSISAANTWEYKTITIAGDTSGTWPTGTNEGVGISFSLGAGPDASGTAGAWNSNNNPGATGQTQVIGTLNATWYITGVQFEIGSVATPFERRPYGTELMLCQRYYWKGGNACAGIFNSGTTARFGVLFPVEMRAAPTVSAIAAPQISNPTVTENQTGSQTTDFIATATSGLVNTLSASKIQFGGFSSGADGRPCSLNNAPLQFSAEL